MQVLKEEIRIQILQAAEKMFCEKGFLETTTRSIAKEAKISVSNLYLYYENKEMLFNAVAEPIFQQFIFEFHKIMDHDDRHGDLKQNMSFVIGQMIAASRGKFLLIFDKSKGTKYEGFRNQVISFVQEHISNQMNDNITDKFLMSGIFARNLIQGIVTIVNAHKDEKELEQNLKDLTEFHAEGIKQFIR